jgi:xanthosine utilization system XapX-like protein
MRNWTRRDWVVALVLIAGGLVGARLFPEFWDNVVVSIAAVAFFGMIIVGTWRGQRQAREEEAQKEARRQRSRERFRKSGPEGG